MFIKNVHFYYLLFYYNKKNTYSLIERQQMTRQNKTSLLNRSKYLTVRFGVR